MCLRIFTQNMKIESKKSNKNSLMRYKRKTKQNRKKCGGTFMPKRIGCAQERKNMKKIIYIKYTELQTTRIHRFCSG